MNEQDRWYERGACFRTETTLADFSDDDNPSRALEICAICPVRGACLLADFKESYPEGLTYGVRGGYTYSERTEIFTEWDEDYPTPARQKRRY